MTPAGGTDRERPAPLLLSPNVLVPPRLERGPQPASPTRELVAARWPEIESLAAGGRISEAVAALEELAREMHRATGEEPPDWRPTLGLARRTVYHSMVQLAEHAGRPEIARGALERCRTWDSEWAGELSELSSRAAGRPT